MKRLIIVLGIILCAPIFANAQQSKLDKAISMASEEQYTEAITLYRTLYKTLTPKDSVYGKFIYAYTAALHHNNKKLLDKNDFSMLYENANEYINIATKGEPYLDVEMHPIKYWSYKSLVVACNSMGKKDLAAKYRAVLYDAYKKNSLPKGLDKHYNFEKLTYNGFNIWGYEMYAVPGDPGTEGSFSKHAYFVYSQDENGNDKDELYSIQTVKVHKLKNDLPDYVLTKRTNSGEDMKSESLWQYTFNEPVNYDELRKAVMEVVKGNYSPTIQSTIKK